MGTASSGEWIAILLYFALVIGVGVYFFIRDRHVEGEKEYFLGGRSMGGWVAALSAGASDMSAWVLMGLPGSIYLYGIGKVWIAVGLVIGTICAWVFVAPRLRRYSIRANDSITIPQFLTNRFQSKNKGLQIISAIVFVVVYCVYSASSISACGTLFNTVTGMSAKTAMIIATAIILVYVFLGGFNAVCWTDFFQGMLMLAALMLTPILALFVMKGADFVAPVMAVPENYYNVLSGGGFNWKSMSDIISGLGWGLGYFGMPHILVRYLSIKSEHEMRKSQIIGCSWIVLILAMSAVVGLIGRQFLGEIDNENLVFVHMVRRLFPAFISGVLLSAILAAAMSTADSQLLASSSAFASDIYKPVIRKDATDKQKMLVLRVTIVVFSAIAVALTLYFPTVLALQMTAYTMYGAAITPAILFALFSKRVTPAAGLAGIIVGGLATIVWTLMGTPGGVQCAIVAVPASVIAILLVSAVTKNSDPARSLNALYTNN